MALNNTKSRITANSFNIIKGIAMVGVVLIHMRAHYPMDELVFPIRLIYILMPFARGYMPLFLAVSGYGFKEKTVKKGLITSFQSLIKPYLWVMLVFVAIYPFTFRLWWGEWAYGIKETLMYLVGMLLGLNTPRTLFGYEVYHCTFLWFFLTSFWAYNLVNLILKVKNEKYQLLLVALTSMFGYQLAKWNFGFYCFAQGLMATGYFYMGYMMRTHNLLARAMNKVWTYVVIVPITVLFAIFAEFDLGQGIFRFGIAEYLASYFVGIFLMYAGVYLDRLEGKVIDFFGKIGMYTYWILCIHIVENACFQWWGYVRYIPNQNIAYMGEFVLKIIIITGACYGLKKYTQYKYQKKRKLQCSKANASKT